MFNKSSKYFSSQKQMLIHISAAWCSHSRDRTTCQTLMAGIRKSCLVDTVLSSSKQHLQVAAPAVAPASWRPGQVMEKEPGPRWYHLLGEGSSLTSWRELKLSFYPQIHLSATNRRVFRYPALHTRMTGLYITNKKANLQRCMCQSMQLVWRIVHTVAWLWDSSAADWI